jgi:hypothetical protein
VLICLSDSNICSWGYSDHLMSAVHNSVHNSWCDRSASTCHKLPVHPMLLWSSRMVFMRCCSATTLYTNLKLAICSVLQLRKETYSRLTPTQRLQVARHPNRPTCLDIILNITGTAAADRLACHLP